MNTLSSQTSASALEAPRRVLVVAGSDSSGCSGLQADLRVLNALGIHPVTAVTAVTVQTSKAVHETSPVDAFLVERQVAAVLDDLGVDCIKLGMLAQSSTIELLSRVFESKARGTPIVLDPILFSSGGVALLDPGSLDVLVKRLMPMCALITPNLSEAAALTGIVVENEADMHLAADQLLLMGQDAVLIKGGHLPGDRVVDLLRTADGVERRFERARLPRDVRGTGCTLSSAIAAGFAEGVTLETAVQRACQLVGTAIEGAVRWPNGVHSFAPNGFFS